MELLAKLKMKLNFIITIIQIKRGQQNKLMTNEKDCDVCKKSGKTHFRVKSINYTKWIFCCKKCWNIISKEDQYSYGGTRKK